MARLRIQAGSTETFEVDVQAEEVTKNDKSIQKLLLVTKAAAAAEALSTGLFQIETRGSSCPLMQWRVSCA